MTYTLGCLTKHFNNFWVLCGGRVLCGIATSLLFSAFESWLVSEHFKVNAAPIQLLLLRRGCVRCCNEPQLAVGPGRRRPYCSAAFERWAWVAAGASAPACWARPFSGVHPSGHPSLPLACNACLSAPSFADVLTPLTPPPPFVNAAWLLFRLAGRHLQPGRVPGQRPDGHPLWWAHGCCHGSPATAAAAAVASPCPAPNSPLEHKGLAAKFFFGTQACVPGRL